MAQDKQQRGKAPQTKQQGGQHEDENKQQGDQRTPDKTIGQIKYARGQDKITKGKGSSGGPETSNRDRRTLTNFDQSKRGLQDDHDPRDIGQKSANRKLG